MAIIEAIGHHEVVTAIAIEAAEREIVGGMDAAGDVAAGRALVPRWETRGAVADVLAWGVTLLDADILPDDPALADLHHLPRLRRRGRHNT